MTRTRKLLAVLLVLAAAGPAAAQPKGRKVAFVVGVGSFKHDPPDLNGSPQKDAKALAAVLKDGGFEVALLTDKDATKDKIERRFKALVDGDGPSARPLGREDLLLVSFGTHGYTLPPADGKEPAPYLAAHDSRTDRTDTLVPLNELFARGRECGATCLYLIDASREPRERYGQSGLSTRRMRPPTRAAVLFSCGDGQMGHMSDRANGHGLFTYAVLKVLRGETGIKGEVTWGDLVSGVEELFRSAEFKALIPPAHPQRPLPVYGELDVVVVMWVGNPAPPPASLDAEERAYQAAVNRGGSARMDHLRAVVPGRLASWRERAEKGDPAAQVLYGRCFDFGVGVKKDQVEAVKWYRKAAEAGSPTGMSNLGSMYHTGDGVKKDEAEAVKWYRKAADLGNAAGMRGLGLMHRDGQGGLAADDAEAAKWFQKSAAAGHVRSYFDLGQLSESQPDEAVTFNWYKKAADAGYAPGFTWLGLAYLTGRGAEKDEAEGVKWIKKGAEAGEASAMLALGRLNENGKAGLARNRTEAAKWYKKAADLGNETAKMLLEQLQRD